MKVIRPPGRSRKRQSHVRRLLHRSIPQAIRPELVANTRKS
jgi:hypothetical protein